MTTPRILSGLLAGLFTLGLAGPSFAQSVALPVPRLLTTVPMGGQTGTTFPVIISGQNLDGAHELLFSSNGIIAVPEKDQAGQVIPNHFTVTVAPETPVGIYEARAVSRLGLSSPRIFSVGGLPEVTRTVANTTQQTAMELGLNTVCNANVSGKAIDYYSIRCDQKTRLLVECAATGIDSKLKPVVTISDAAGRDLAVDRRHGILDFTVPQAGQYLIKIHDLTFGGGPEFFYRLYVQSLPETAVVKRQFATQKVNAVSIPAAMAHAAGTVEIEPNNAVKNAQQIELPCEIDGAFFPAADVDTFEFTAKKGDVWWVEVVSERLGLPTNPFVLVQRVIKDGESENAVDVAEFNDLASPVKLSTGAYTYNGSPYDVGTTDALGKLEIKEDGLHRLQVRDLFGGTRKDPRCTYRLIIRKAEPDFFVTAWAKHMELRNGDRNVLSKPIALRNGGSMMFEVVVIRKDGFDAPIEIGLAGLPEGISATGLTIPAGANQGTLLISSVEGATTVMGTTRLIATAQLNGTAVEREGRVASMVWPVVDQWQETPNPRLLCDIAVSSTAAEAAPLTVSPEQPEYVVAAAEGELKIPLKLTWRGNFSGALQLSPIGAGFEKVKPIDVTLNSPATEVTLNLADLKLSPGKHSFALFGGLVTAYRYNVAAVDTATEELRLVNEEIQQLTAASQAATAAVQSATDETRAASEEAAKSASAALQGAETRKTEIDARLKAATAAATPSEIVDIVVSEPIRILVQEPATK